MTNYVGFQVDVTRRKEAQLALADEREHLDRLVDRIYLPREALQRHGVDYAAVESLTISDGMGGVIREELERTEARYREGVAGIRYLPEDVQFGVLLAAVLYAEHHRLIRCQGYDVISQTPSLSTPRRLALRARTWYHWRRSHDPEAVFEAVSAVPDTATDGRSTESRFAEDATTSEAPPQDTDRPQSS